MRGPTRAAREQEGRPSPDAPESARHRRRMMTPRLRLWVAAVGVVAATAAADRALAQKPGGVLQMSHFDSPASMSLQEEATAAVNRPMMGVFNNLVMFRQDVPQNSMQSIVPDLATG